MLLSEAAVRGSVHTSATNARRGTILVCSSSTRSLRSDTMLSNSGDSAEIYRTFVKDSQPCQQIAQLDTTLNTEAPHVYESYQSKFLLLGHFRKIPGDAFYLDI
jgi:hypothetical protein